MSDITPGSILDRVVQELPNFFRDGVDQIATGEGEYIRAGEPRGTVGQVGQAVARSYCRQYGADPGAAKFGNAARIENACRPYLDDIDPGNGATIGIPFEGGQCDDIYQIRWDDGTGDFAIGGSILGPLTAVGARLVTPLGSGPAGTAQYEIEATGAGGFLLAETIGTFSASAPTVRAVNLTDIADDCGDPPPAVTQPGPIADPTSPTFRFNPSGDININVGVDILPNGTINLNIGGPTVNVNPFGGGAGAVGNDPVGGAGSPGSPSDTGVGGDTEGNADEGEELVGVLVQVLGAPVGANRFFNNSELVYRGAYYVAMGYPGRLGLDMSGGTAETLQFFHAQQRGLTNYRVRANVGFNLRATPYYRELES